jgi:hypothetical protein
MHLHFPRPRLLAVASMDLLAPRSTGRTIRKATPLLLAPCENREGCQEGDDATLHRLS